MTLPKGFYDKARLLMDEQVDAIADRFAKVCESPIEVAFGTAFVTLGDHGYGVAQIAWPEDSDLSLHDNDASVVLAPQRTLLGYRADFIAFPVPYRPKAQIIVECDGHEWHERTKEQAQHDRSRDRDMQSAGFKVFRFTGSEIYRDAFGCAEEVLRECIRLGWY